MYKEIFLLFLLFSTQVYANLIINEVMYNPSTGQGSDSDMEWIELFNNGTEIINLSNYALDGNSLSGMLNTNEYIVIARNNESFSLFYLPNYTVLDLQLSLVNGEDNIVLTNGSYIEELDYSSSWGANGNGYSLERVDFSDSWKESLVINGTPGYSNSNVFLNVSVIGLLEITEFIPDPQGSDSANIPDGEWVELYNSGSIDLDLLGFILKDKNDDKELIITSTSVINTTIIKPNEYKVIYRNENGRFTLNNNEFEKVRLYDQKLDLIDEVSYSTSKEAVSWSKLNDAWTLSIPSPGEENIEESVDESYIKIESIMDLGSDKKAKFGQNIRVDVEIYKGDTTKNNVKFYIENSAKERLSKITDINVYNKFLTYDLTIPLQINPNCKNEFNETDYTIKAEGLNTTASTALKIEGITKALCEKIKVSLKETEEVSYEILEYPEEIIFGNKSVIKLKVTNKDTDEKNIEAWSYIYKGNKAISGDRESNKKLIKIPAESSVISDLTNEIVEEASGDYKLKIRIKEEERKTPEEFTLDVTIKTLAATLEKEDVINTENNIKKAENTITGNTIYQDSNIKTKRSAVFFFTGTLVVFLLFLAIKKPL